MAYGRGRGVKSRGRAGGTGSLPARGHAAFAACSHGPGSRAPPRAGRSQGRGPERLSAAEGAAEVDFLETGLVAGVRGLRDVVVVGAGMGLDHAAHQLRPPGLLVRDLAARVECYPLQLRGQLLDRGTVPGADLPPDAVVLEHEAVGALGAFVHEAG